MQARAAPMPVVRGDRAEAYSLAHDSEVVAGAAVGEAGAPVPHQERGRPGPQQPVPLPCIGPPLGGRAVGEGHGGGPCRGLRRLAAQEERGAEVRGAFLVRKGEKSTQDPFVRAEVIAEAAPDGQIALQLLRPVVHATPPATGQGWAIVRKPSRSSLAYSRVVA